MKFQGGCQQNLLFQLYGRCIVRQLTLRFISIFYFETSIQYDNQTTTRYQYIIIANLTTELEAMPSICIPK